MSEAVTPDQAALELAAPRTDCALNTPVSIPTSYRQVLSHLAIVLLVTGSFFPFQERNKCVLPVTEAAVENCSVACSYAWFVVTEHTSVLSGNLFRVKEICQ